MQANNEVIERLREAGVKLVREAAADPAGLALSEERALPLAGLTFVLTGTLASMSRSRSEARIKALGGSCSANVTRRTNYLVVGEAPGSKLEAATRLGTGLLTENEFLALLEPAR